VNADTLITGLITSKITLNVRLRLLTESSPTRTLIRPRPWFPPRRRELCDAGRLTGFGASTPAQNLARFVAQLLAHRLPTILAESQTIEMRFYRSNFARSPDCNGALRRRSPKSQRLLLLGVPRDTFAITDTLTLSF